MALKVVRTRYGEVSLEEAHDHIAADDPDAADRFLEGVFEITDLLVRFP